MKNKLFILLTITFLINSFAQFGSRQIFEIDLGSRFVFGDIDNDNDQDLIAIKKLNLTGPIQFSWYENLAELDNYFGSKRLIENTLDSFVGLPYIIDFDQDGDNDILILTGTYHTEQKDIVWFENLDGLGNFSFKQILIENITNYFNDVSITPIDMDMDGDLDIFIKGSNYPSVNFWYSTMGWFRNDNGNYEHIHINYIPYNDYSNTKITDVDGDNDLDIIYTGEFSKTKWLENDGFLNYSNIHNINSRYRNNLNDIDNDGDIDVISYGAYSGNPIFWEENDGLGNFSESQILVSINDVPNSNKVFFYDFDKDEDLDILVPGRQGQDTVIKWFKNDGTGVFSESQILIQTEFDGVEFENFYSIFDIDSDGLNDIITKGDDSSIIYWYKNLTSLSIDQNSLQKFSVYPIPTNNNILIRSKSEITKIEIYNNLGILVLFNFNKDNIDITTLNNGLYTMKVKGKNGVFEVKKIIKN